MTAIERYEARFGVLSFVRGHDSEIECHLITDPQEVAEVWEWEATSPT